MQIRRALGLSLLFLLALPAVAAHGVYEASELEVHLINDEGSDLIESYGGYDIQDLFIGFAHDPAVGSGEDGDGFYLRVVLYGLMENSVPVQEPWTVTFTIGTPAGDIVRTLTTKDGVTLESDFDDLTYEIVAEERTTLVQRAFVSFTGAGISPGTSLGPFTVASRVGGDLRDIAPGGIPVPGTNGAAMYPDPTQIDGQGILVDSVTAVAPTGYTLLTARAVDAERFRLTVTSALHEGGQHVMVDVLDAPGWDLRLEGNTSAPVEPDGNFTLDLVVVPTSDVPGNATIEVRTDIGGRSVLSLRPDGALVLPDGTVVAPMQLGETESTPFPWWVTLVALALWVRRR